MNLQGAAAAARLAGQQLGLIELCASESEPAPSTGLSRLPNPSLGARLPGLGRLSASAPFGADGARRAAPIDHVRATARHARCPASAGAASRRQAAAAAARIWRPDFHGGGGGGGAQWSCFEGAHSAPARPAGQHDDWPRRAPPTGESLSGALAGLRAPFGPRVARACKRALASARAHLAAGTWALGAGRAIIRFVAKLT